MTEKKRRYDLDWLRVIAILAVYFHHIGMPFNGDGFHIMNTESSKLLDDIMVFFEQFRLPLLFLISGTGTMFAFSKRTWFQFLKERSTRLLIPLIFGVLFIVPPQTYFEDIQKFNSYWDVYTSGSFFESNHLWFIENLFILSVILIPLILFLKSSKSYRLINLLDTIASKKYGIFLWTIPLIVITILLKKIYPSDSKDITNLSSTFYYGYFFVSGMLFTSSRNIWHHLKSYRKFNFIAFVISSILFYGFYLLPNDYISQYLSINSRWNIWYLVCALVSWTLVTTLLGYGQIWFNKKGVLLKKCNEAIYPFYILHQTIIIILGYYIIQLDVSILSKIGLLIITSFPLIVIIYRLFIYPFKIPRILFGMKNNRKKIMSNKLLFVVGILGVSLFVVSSILGGILIENYSLTSQYISETYAIDTEYGIVLRAFGYMPSGILLTIFAFVGYKKFPKSKQIKIGFWGLSIFYGIATIIVGVFPCDKGCNKELVDPSISQIIHNLTGLLTYIFVPISIILISFGLKKSNNFHGLSKIGFTCGLISIVFIGLLLSDPLTNYAGFFQRIIEGMFIIWISACSIFIKRGSNRTT